MITLSQSYMKAINHGRERSELASPDMAKCPSKAKAIYIEGMESIATDAMTRGNYFETLVFGSTDSGKVVHMEPTKSGKSVAQERVEYHATNLVRVLKPQYVMDWHSPREHIMVAINDKYQARARTDMITSQKLPDGSIATKVIQDYKITDSILSNHGDFAWGVPEAMDHTQASFYTWAAELKYGVRMPFYYWVFDLSTAKMWKVVGGVIKDTMMNAFKADLKRTIQQTERYLVDGWPLIPSYDNCKGCPLRNSCPAYKQGADFQIIW